MTETDATKKLAENIATILGRREKITAIHQLIAEHVEAQLQQERERVEKLKHELIISRDVFKAIDIASHGMFPQTREVLLNRIATIDIILKELEE